MKILSLLFILTLLVSCKNEKAYVEGSSGNDGESCSVDQSGLLTCGDGSEHQVEDGKDGLDGQDGLNGKDGLNGIIQR